MRFTIPFLLILVMLGPGLSMAQPGGGGATFIPTFSYHDPSTFLLRCDMTGAYLTTDGGQHYRQLNFPGGAQSFAFDPADENKIYVGAAALWQSTDRGKTWQQLYPRPEQVAARTYSGDHAELSLTTIPGIPYWAPGQTIRCIRVDPADNRRIYFTVGISLFYSPDAGASWQKKDFAHPLQYLYLNQTVDGGSLFLFAKDSLYVLDRALSIHTARAYPAAMRPASQFAAGVLKHTAKAVFYGLRPSAVGKSAAGVWVSTDEGRHWSVSSSTAVSALACSEYDAAHAYAAVREIGERQPHGVRRIDYGVFGTRDAGGHWNWVWKAGGGSGAYGVPDGHNPVNLQDGWAGKAFGREYVEIMDVGVAPQDGSIAVVTDWYRVTRTANGGRTWANVYSQPLPGGAAASTGLDVTTTYGVHFDPYNKKHLAVSCTDIGYHHSFDGGKSWIRSVAGVPADWVNTCYWVAFDPTVRDKCWGAWSGTHDLPRGKMTRDPQWKTRCRGGICVSNNGGRTWAPTVNGMGYDAPATSIVVDPHSPPGSRILYATVYNKGVFKSVDDGRTWVLHNNGIGDNTCAFEITLAGNGDLYLVVSPTPDFAHAPNFYPGAVYKSTNGAATWQLLHPARTDTLFPSGIGVDPANPQRIYLACWAGITLGDLYGAGVRSAGGDRRIAMPGGVFRSEDAGQSWTQVLGGDQYVYDVTVDGHHPGRIYCNTFTGVAYRSDDYGSSWRPIKGYNFKWGHRVVVDENDPDQVYITTYGSGIRHLAADTASTVKNP